MTSSARFAETDFPAEVEDLMSSLPSDSALSCCAVAGYAVIASANCSQALVFAIAVGSALDSVSIPLQSHQDSCAPSLATWTRSQRTDSLTSVAVAALTRDGTLRVYNSVDVRSRSRPRAEQVRLGSALAASVRDDTAPPALHVCRAIDGSLYVFGGRGSGAIVHDRGGRLHVRPLFRSTDADTGSIRFGAMFYSAIKSIGAVAGGRDDDWENGTGGHEIITCKATAGQPGVIVVRKAGEVERWGSEGRLWSFSVFDFEGGRDSARSVLSAGVTTDDTAVLLVQSRSEVGTGHKIVCFDVRSSESIPKRTEMVVPLNDDHVDPDSQCLMVVSGDIAYFYVEGKKTMAWLSVARGVPPEGQVQGSTTVDSDLRVLSMVDASYGLPESATTGGIAAFIHASGVWLVSSSVPAPVSLDDAVPMAGLTSVAAAAPDIWRSLLQYSADQKGAAKASLRGLVKSLLAEGFDVSESLCELVRLTSRKIIVSDQDPESTPLALLIDTELQKKCVQHRMFLRYLADAEIFSGIRPDSPSVTEDRIWDAISIQSRFHVVTDGEKLASARRVRDLENRHSAGGYSYRFNGAASKGAMGSERTASDLLSRSRRGIIENEETLANSENVLKSALSLGGTEASEATHATLVDEVATRLYRFPHEFHSFLPALERCMMDSLSKMQAEQDMAADISAESWRIYRRAAENTVLLSCEAAIEVVQGSKEARSEADAIFETLPHDMDGIDNWMADSKTCGDMLMRIAQRALEIGVKGRQSDESQVTSAAFLVIDELLSRTSEKSAWNDRSPDSGRRWGESTPQKRRRTDLAFENTTRGKEVRSALDMLRNNGMTNEAFVLAEKYGDYGTMLALKVSSSDFNQFMEDALEKFGDGFGLFSFHWLEDRGHVRLLLQGGNLHHGVRDAHLSRSNRLNRLLSEYFRTDRAALSNLSWIHSISQGDYEAASSSLVSQTKKVSVPGREGSAINTAVLGSIAKLALRVADGDQHDRRNLNSSDYEFISGRLLLANLQGELDPNSGTLRPCNELIRELMKKSATESDRLSEQVAMAIEALQYSEIDANDAQLAMDHVWYSCVERQRNLWIPLVKSLGSTNDMEMRKTLRNTALYRAAVRVDLKEPAIAEVISRGAFDHSEFAKLGCLPEVARLMRATVSLAAA